MSDSASLRLLVVDDEDAMVRLLTAVATHAGWSAPRHAGTGREALEAAGEADIILLDHNLPDTTGLELIPSLRARPNRPAVILVTAFGSEALAADALRHGADDYLIKNQALSELLPEVLERVRRMRALREALAAAERDLVHAERRVAIGQMSVTLHHTLNNPLMAASIEAQLLLAGPDPLTPLQRESVEAVQRALLQMSETIQRAQSLGHDETTEYIAGVSMIDLSRRTQPAPALRGEALLLLPEEDTARVIGLLLRHAGFIVNRVADAAGLAVLAGRPDVALVLIDASGAMSGEGALGGFHPVEGHSYTLVALARDDGAEARRAGADQVIQLPFDPGRLVDDLLEAMRER